MISLGRARSERGEERDSWIQPMYARNVFSVIVNNWLLCREVTRMPSNTRLHG